MALKKIKLPDNSVVDVQDSRIPAPQSSDNGKVLGVTSAAGAMGWVEQSGGATTPTLLIGNLTDEEKAQNIAVIEELFGNHNNSFSVAQTLDFVYNGAVYAEYALHQIDKIDSNTYHLTVSVTHGEDGGYTSIYKLIIQGGVYTGAETLCDTVTGFFLNGVNYGAEGEEHTVTGTVQRLLTYANATYSALNYYIVGYGLSYGYNKQSTYYECFFSSGDKDLRLRVYSDGHVTTTWSKKANYYKPSTGIPASDLAEDTVATISPRVYVGTCTTAAATAAKVVTVETFPLDGNGKPLVGTMIAVKSTYTNSASGFTLNVNSTGAASIYYSGSVSTTNVTAGYANRYTYYVWDGTYWVWISGGIDNNDNTLAYQVRTNSTSRYLSDFVSRYRLLFTSADGSKWVPANTSTNTTTTAAKAVNQRPINPFGDIVYYNSTTTRSAGTEVGVTTQFFKVHGIALGYSFNRTGSALALTSFVPVYVVCKPATDGSAIIDGDTPIVQALPTTEDGKIYIFLGLPYSGTALELFPNHPVYWYKDGAIRLYTNSNSNTQKEEDENISGYLSRAIGSNESWAETLATVTVSEGYIYGADGTIASTSDYWNYYTIPLGTAKKVRFNGFAPNEPPSSSDAWSSGYAFYDSNDNCVASTNWAIDTSLPAHTEKEFIVDVPTGATTLRVTNAKDDAYYCYTKKRPFYCYLMEGKTISEMSVQAVNNCTKIWAGTQAQYDLLTPDSDTLYLITG